MNEVHMSKETAKLMQQVMDDEEAEENERAVVAKNAVVDLFFTDGTMLAKVRVIQTYPVGIKIRYGQMTVFYSWATISRIEM